jgi:hypothetical protein
MYTTFRKSSDTQFSFYRSLPLRLLYVFLQDTRQTWYLKEDYGPWRDTMYKFSSESLVRIRV